MARNLNRNYTISTTDVNNANTLPQLYNSLSASSPNNYTTTSDITVMPAKMYTKQANPKTPSKKGELLKKVFDDFNLAKMWNKKQGVTPLGIGKFANIGSGITQGIQGIQNLSNLGQSTSDYNDLQGDILAAYSSNPLASSYLSPDQMRMIRQIRRGNLPENTTATQGAFNEIINNLGNTLTSAGIGLATGGIPGALIGSIGGLVNSGLSGANKAKQSNISQLDALYQSLVDAQAQYNAMKRPNMTGLGLQQRYQQLYQ